MDKLKLKDREELIFDVRLCVKTEALPRASLATSNTTSSPIGGEMRPMSPSSVKYEVAEECIGI